jgi:hypothetical protein
VIFQGGMSFFFFAVRLGVELDLYQLEDLRPVYSALDDKICTTDAQRDMR